MEVIPVINCPDSDCIAEKVRTAEGFSEWVHLDVADARFTFGRSGGSAEGWSLLGARVKLEVHLMVEEPEQEVPQWLSAGAKRVIVHLESFFYPLHRRQPVDAIALVREMQSQCASHDATLMLAISPETPLVKAKSLMRLFSEFQILAVHAGPPGQAFLPLSLEKIKLLRREAPHARIEVDGGIVPETALRVQSAGANVVVSGTYIFNDRDPRSAYKKLTHI